MQENIKNFVENSKFQNFIIALIIINGITMGFETSKGFMESYGSIIHIFDKLVITIFTLEIMLRIYAHRVSFFKDTWSLFDFAIVAISLVPSTGGFEIFRILRVIRLLRLITVVPQMRKIVMALVSVIPGMLSIAGLLMLLFYIFAIMATQLYSESFPLWFGTLGESFYTLFQVMTLESWSMGIVRPIMEVHPYAWTFFIPFIFMVTFIMINLIVAVVVDAMAEINKDETSCVVEEIHTHEDHTALQLKALQLEIRELKELVREKL
ncbi:Voltage-gated sodium channel [Sulfurimonas gotlandica GD1]|uniref:Voltage-gated sodium channel n=1 Tax=Sulfurimonas gotlandica (strain DSM 19862 / JCM 16533 / GD1) TaxID=929558 RepID=H1FU52_SULGG|nr:ion transporter [Sulfurimonas gotlandica]EHP31358.1 Voltage-gated sodium channel [Sulfurimonas gotlandica GD1]